MVPGIYPIPEGGSIDEIVKLAGGFKRGVPGIVRGATTNNRFTGPGRY